jgi:hypothetical protein
MITDIKFSEWLVANEMALRKMELVPSHDPADPKSRWAKKTKGWDDTDRRLVTSPAGVQKFTRLWANTEHNFDFYLVNLPSAAKYSEHGEVNTQWLAKNMPELAHLSPAEDAITIIYVGNTGAEKVHFSAWTAAHRFGHAIRRSSVTQWNEFVRDLEQRMTEILKHYYGVKTGRSMYGSFPDRNTEKLLARLATKMGTMRSARQNNLRNFNEFAYEVLAQYLVTKNKVQFNGQLERMLATKFAWGRPSDGAYMKHDADKDELESEIHGIADYCNEMLNEVMLEANGKIFVM